jgi:hypothetical protein
MEDISEPLGRVSVVPCTLLGVEVGAIEAEAHSVAEEVLKHVQ